VKKVVDRHPADLAGMKMAVEKAADMAIEKKRRIIRYLSSVS